MNQESFGIQQCCRLLSTHFKSANLKQVMLLMKHSLDLTNPWIGHYRKIQEPNEIGKNIEKVKYLKKAGMLENEDKVMQLFSGIANDDFLQQHG